MGSIEVSKPGRFDLRLHLDKILPQPKDKPLWDDLSPLVVQVRLVPVK
jgi:hypothetical protein